MRKIKKKTSFELINHSYEYDPTDDQKKKELINHSQHFIQENEINNIINKYFGLSNTKSE